MAYVKLDCGILDSTLWVDRDARELFITSLLMAEPREILEPVPQIAIRSLEQTSFQVPPGWYGFVPAAGSGIIRRAGMEMEAGLSALERLGEPDSESRSPQYEGRRMCRIDGGFIILNFSKYREKDHTAAERSRRWRERKSSRVSTVAQRVTTRSATQAEAEAEAETKKESVRSLFDAREFAEIPSIEEVVTFGQMSAGIPEDYCRHYHDQRTVNNAWVKNGAVIKWKLDIAGRNWWAKDRETWFRKDKNGSSVAAVRSVFELREIIKAKETLATQIKERHSSQAAMGLNWSNREKQEEWKSLRAEIKQLTTQMARMA